MSHVPSLPTLRAFDAAARHRSFSRAGEELGLTHGAISHRIRELEEQLGERLFMRRGNAMEPTDAAGQYLAAVRQALDLLNATFNAGHGSTRRRTLRISALPSFASHWLVARLPHFEAEQPQIAVAIDARLEVVPLGRGHADAAIRHGKGNWPGVHAQWLAGEIIFPVCAPAYRERMAIEEPSDLARCRLLRHAWSPWTRWFSAAGLNFSEPDDSAVFADAGLLIDTAIAGHGVLLARDILVADAIASGRLVRLFETSIPFDDGYWFVRPQSGGRFAQDAIIFGEWLGATLAREFPASV